MTIQERLQNFKSDLEQDFLTNEQVFQKHIIDSNSYLFHDFLRDYKMEYKVRSLIALYLGIHLNEVLIVGSSKVGFSTSPTKLYRGFDNVYKSSKLFKDKSDLDIAIISTELFASLNIKIYEFTNSFTMHWKTNEYYDNDKIKNFKIPINYKFFEYHTRGWFRPDFKPIGFEVCHKGTLEELKKEIQIITGRKLAMGIYSNWYFFKNYHMRTLTEIRNASKTTII